MEVKINAYFSFSGTLGSSYDWHLYGSVFSLQFSISGKYVSVNVIAPVKYSKVTERPFSGMKN